MRETQRSLSDLIDLAQKSSSENRRQLLREVTDLFLEAPEAHSDTEQEHFGSIMGQIARDVEMALRRDLAEKLATVPGAPKSLIVQLANDEIDVARPILMQSAGLGDRELLAVVHGKGQEHLAAIAARKAVSTVVTGALVKRADDAVLEQLVANQGAAFSREAMEQVVARAEGNERLHAPVLGRKDLPPDLMQDMFFFVSSQLKAFILKRSQEMDPGELDRALAGAERRAARRLRQVQTPESAAERFVAEKESKRELNEMLLTSLLRERRMPEFKACFARLTGIDARTVRHILGDKGHEGLAIAARAARFDRSTFSTIILLTDPEAQHAPGEVQKSLALYDKIPVETAQRIIRFWKVRRQAIKEEAGSAASA
jgi:uncharacterized protein (DUF2336 family)